MLDTREVAEDSILISVWSFAESCGSMGEGFLLKCLTYDYLITVFF